MPPLQQRLLFVICIFYKGGTLCREDLEEIQEEDQEVAHLEEDQEVVPLEDRAEVLEVRIMEVPAVRRHHRRRVIIGEAIITIVPMAAVSFHFACLALLQRSL